MKTHLPLIRLFIGTLICLSFIQVKAGGIKIGQECQTLIAPTGCSYRWMKDNSILKDASRQKLGIKESGTYKVEITQEDGKTETSDISVIVSPNSTIMKVYLIGDSTVQNYSVDSYPQTGWGQVLPYFFDPSGVQVINKAVGSSSSKSFYNHYWANIRDSIKPGDFVFIQFGINDGNQGDTSRYAPPYTLFTYYITQYVNECRAKGAIPVLLTNVRQNTWNANRTPYNSYPEYPVVMRNLADSLQTPLIDLYAMELPLMKSFGKMYTTWFLYDNYMPGEYPNYPGGNIDNTNFQEMGAIEIARLVTKGIRSQSDNPNMRNLIAFLKPMYPVTVKANIPPAGIVTRTSVYPAGLTITLQAMTAPGHTFLEWTEGNRILTDYNFYRFTMTTTSRSFEAYFDSLPIQDCNGDLGGSAQIDNCGICTGGNTGRTACVDAIQGEDACSIQGILDANGHAGFLGTGYADGYNSIGAAITWSILSTSAQTVTLTFRYASGSANNRKAALIVNGDTTIAFVSFPGTGSWTTWKYADVTVSLNQGNNWIELTPTTSEGCANIDLIATSSAGISQGSCLVTGTIAKSDTETNLFPNPFTGSFQIHSPGMFTYSISDFAGRTLETGTGTDDTKAGSELPSGFYLLKLSKNGENRVFKVSKE